MHHIVPVRSDKAIALVTAAAITVVLPVPGGPWIRVILSLSACERMALTASVWETLRGDDGKYTGTQGGGDELSAQDDLSPGSQMLWIKGCFNSVTARWSALRTSLARSPSALVGPSFPTVSTDLILCPLKAPLTLMVAARPLTCVARPVTMTAFPLFVVLISMVCETLAIKSPA